MTLAPFAAYAAAALTFAVLDTLWLGFIAKSLYRQGIGHLMAPDFNLLVGGVFYLLFPVALVFFAVAPAAQAAPARAALLGALLGLTAYATYNLTNLATLRDWPLGLSLIDGVWGASLSALAALAGHAAWSLVTR